MAFTPSPYADVSSFASIATGQLSNGQVGVWVVDDHGGLHGRWTNDPNPSLGWANWTAMGTPGVPLSKVAVVQLADNRLEMYAIDVNGRLWSQTQSGVAASSHWDSWKTVATPSTFVDGAVSTLSNGQVAFWGLSGEGDLYYSWKTSTDPLAAWSASWYDRSLPGVKLSDVLAVDHGGILRVYAVDDAGKKIYEYHQVNTTPGSQWTDWTPSYAMTAASSDYSLRNLTATILPESYSYKMSGGALRIWGTAQLDPNQSQIRPTRLADATLPNPAFGEPLEQFDVNYDDLTNLSEVSAVQYVDGRQIAVFATTTDGRVFENYNVNNNDLGKWSNWVDLGADFKAQNAIPKPTNLLPPVDPPHVDPPHVDPPPVDPPPVDPPHVDPPHVDPPHVDPPHVVPPHVDPPHVVPSVSPSVSGSGATRDRRRRVIEVRVYFSMPMDPASASTAANYQLYTLSGKGRRAKQIYVPISYASYDPSRNATILKLAKPQSAKSLQLTLTTWNLRGAQGGTLIPTYPSTIY